jgi:hypothetical protein
MSAKKRLAKLVGGQVDFATGYEQTGGAPHKRRGWWKRSARLGVGAIIPGQPGNWLFLGYNAKDAESRIDAACGAFQCARRKNEEYGNS